MQNRRAGLILCVAMGSVLGCSSSLKVRPATANDASGIPFVLPRQDFVVEELGFDDAGQPVAADGIRRRIALVTGADSSRAFRVTNEPAFLADGKFSITRRSQGVPEAISGEGTSRAQETVTELAALAARLAAFASAEAPAEDENEIEDALKAKRDLLEKTPEKELPKIRAEIRKLELQKELIVIGKMEKALLADLKSLSETGGEKEKRAKTIMDALKELRTRKAAITAALKPKPGVKVSKRTLLKEEEVRVAESADEALAGSKDIAEGEFRIYLVPVDQRSTP